MNIVHPEYFTNTYWFNRVNHTTVTAPAWKRLVDMHPCDYQATMLKGCLPHNTSDASRVYSLERRRRIRAIYYAMILEFDSMVGAYIDAIEQIDGLSDNTVFIITSDHGDMQMEHQQFYKQVAYDASSRVPLIIHLPPSTQSNTSAEDKSSPTLSAVATNKLVTQPTSHIDLFPTIMDLARVPNEMRPDALQGESLLPFLVPITDVVESRRRRHLDHNAGTAPAVVVPRKRPFVVNQFHGCDIAMSWFSIIDERHYKYTVFGTGEEHRPQLFDLLADPGEDADLAGNASFESTMKRLDSLLRSVVDYKKVANEVARYTHTSLGTWVNSTSNWRNVVQDLRWKPSFDVDANASIAAIEAYLAAPPQVYKCRSEPVWPPPPKPV